MRTGACTVQQALTAEAASVVKLSLNLARRRGHAQVTPLHVAATLLTSPSSSSNLLRRACLKSHPHHPPTSHPLQCRALELCFNVALNRLPTTPPPSSGSLIHPQPALSNALVAALKRAQAHQRRGCIEQQQFQHPHHHQQQQQQPLLAIRVELEQLIISILDDPSVSRVMREAGFSSTTVKSNIEEDCSNSSSSSNACSFFFDPSRESAAGAGFLHTHFLKPSPDRNPLSHFSIKEDLKVVFDAMVRKQGRRRNNVVLVGDSVWIAEGLVSEFVGRLERGDVPDEIKSCHFIRMQLSYVQLRAMSKGEMELKVSELRRRLSSSLLTSNVILYVGDLRWAADEAGADGFRPAEHLIEEIRRLVSEMRACRIWLMATASYQSWMRCQARHPSLEAQWALQAVVVPSGGLKLSLQAAPPSGPDSRVAKLTQCPFQMLEPKALYPKEEEDKLHCCAECTHNFEREARDINNLSTPLPFWLQPHRPENPHKDSLLELRRKWNKMCQNFHHSRQSSANLLPSFPSSHHPWWSGILTDNKTKPFMDLNSISFSGSAPKLGNLTPIVTSQIKNRESPKPWLSDVKTTLALGSPAFSDTASSMDQRSGARVNRGELSRKLQENIPWQSETVPAIVEALLDGQSKNGIWLLVQGTDRIAKRRLARVAAESFCGSADKLVRINARSSAGGVAELAEAMREDPKVVILFEDIDQAKGEFIRIMSQSIKTGYLMDPFGREVDLSHAVFILAASSSGNLDSDDESHGRVLRMRLCVEEMSSSDHKRKNSESDSPPNENNNKKKMKSVEAELDLDLNVSAEGSDLTHEIEGNNVGVQLPDGLFEAISAAITMDEAPGGGASRSGESIVARLSSAVDGRLVVDRTAAEGLAGAMGWFLESEFERWVKEIFELSVATVRNGGKVRLGVEGKDGNVAECGFMGTVLPKRIHVE